VGTVAENELSPIVERFSLSSLLSLFQFMDATAYSTKIIDKYANFASLSVHEKEGVDYRLNIVEKHHSGIAILAPHGGSIERRTSPIASAIAADDFNLYQFEGLDPNGSFEVLHITSHRFDEPRCLNLIEDCDIVVAIHGCGGEEKVAMLGGLDTELAGRLGLAIARTGVRVLTEGHAYPGTRRDNICNRGLSGRGVQVELTDALRGSAQERLVVEALRAVLLEY
jgi:phage replication-related protein YjqB (UPF0714/DUF867 family)